MRNRRWRMHCTERQNTGKSNFFSFFCLPRLSHFIFVQTYTQRIFLGNIIMIAIPLGISQKKASERQRERLEAQQTDRWKEIKTFSTETDVCWLQSMSVSPSNSVSRGHCQVDVDSFCSDGRPITELPLIVLMNKGGRRNRRDRSEFSFSSHTHTGEHPWLKPWNWHFVKFWFCLAVANIQSRYI